MSFRRTTGLEAQTAAAATYNPHLLLIPTGGGRDVGYQDTVVVVVVVVWSINACAYNFCY
jgi:predicted S18 family serine protease